MKKKNLIIYLAIFISIISFISYFKYSKEKDASKVDKVLLMKIHINQILWRMSVIHQKMQKEMSIL